MSNTHTVLDGARWPSVACRAQRLAWVAAILKDEGIECYPIEQTIAAALLMSVVTTPHCDKKKVRVACFRAAIELEKIR